MKNSRFKFRVWDKYTNETPAEQMQFLCFNGCLVDGDKLKMTHRQWRMFREKNKGNILFNGKVY